MTLWTNNICCSTLWLMDTHLVIKAHLRSMINYKGKEMSMRLRTTCSFKNTCLLGVGLWLTKVWMKTNELKSTLRSTQQRPEVWALTVSSMEFTYLTGCLTSNRVDRTLLMFKHLKKEAGTKTCSEWPGRLNILSHLYLTVFFTVMYLLSADRFCPHTGLWATVIHWIKTNTVSSI